MKVYKQNIIHWMIVMTGVLSFFLSASLSMAATDETPSVMGHLPVVSSVTLALTAGTTPPADVIEATAVASDPDGDTITYAWQWQRDQQDINGATEREYTPVAADTGHKLRVKVTPITDTDITVPATGAAVFSDETQAYQPSVQLTAHAEIKNYKGANGLDAKATGGNGGTVSYVSGDTSVATVDISGNLTLVGAGTTTITATEAVHGLYPEQKVTTTVTVRAPMKVYDGTDDFGVDPVRDLLNDNGSPVITGGNGATMTWTPSDTDTMTIDANGVARCLKTGDVTLAIHQDANDGFPEGTYSPTVTCRSALVPLTAHAEVKDYTGTGGLDAKAAGGNGGTVSYVSGDTSVATVDTDGNLTLLKEGTATITATEAVHGLYPEQKVTTTVTVKDPIQTYDGGATFSVNQKRDLSMSSKNFIKGNGGDLSYDSNNDDLWFRNDGMAACINTGTFDATVTQAANDGYRAHSVSIQVTCSSAVTLTATIQWSPPATPLQMGYVDIDPVFGTSGKITYEVAAGLTCEYDYNSPPSPEPCIHSGGSTQNYWSGRWQKANVRFTPENGGVITWKKTISYP